MKRVLVTGITGTLGAALGRVYRERGWEVVGVSRRASSATDACDKALASPQRTREDAAALLDADPDVAILNAGQIESEVGPGGLPLPGQTESMYAINLVFPSLFALEAAARPRSRPLDVVAIGSIADGSPSAFGPVYHASKIGLHHFVTGVGPIVRTANPSVRLRLYRPGVIRGPLSWAPVLRLNERGRRVRARRCEGAPEPERVARHVADWIEGDGWVGTFDEPFSFRLLKLLFALAPNTYYRLQNLGWRKGSRFAEEA